MNSAISNNLVIKLVLHARQKNTITYQTKKSKILFLSRKIYASTFAEIDKNILENI